MSDQPLVSILTPSFNQGRWLGDNLASIASQTYPRIEQIVMDGGSTDESIAILEGSGPHVTWRSEPDRGQPHALNKAFEASRGEIIGWVNSDDALFDDRAVAEVVAFFTSHLRVDVVYGHAVRVAADGTIIYVMHIPRFSYWRLQRFCYFVQPAVFIRRSALEDRFLDEEFQFAMDWELWLRLGRTHRFGRLDRVLAVDRTHGERKIKTWAPILAADTDRLSERYGVSQPEWATMRYYPLSQAWARLMGVRHVLALRPPFAFSGPPFDRAAVLRRQLSSDAKWPEEYR